MRVIATAGHVDHGKSTLVRALTGTDPDRLAEEKARGLTIDLGFAATTLPSGAEIGFVDVPGHARFLPNMLAGVGAVDACLLVVAATEGWKPQSEEHLRILELLGVSHGVIALTKVDLVDDDERELASLEVQERVAGTFLASAPIVSGIDNLRAALDALVAATPAASDNGRPRMWVDRSFPIVGAGTVVTGTLAGGSIDGGDELVVLPGGRRSRVRQLRSHDVALTHATPGRRLAVNLPDIAVADVGRGQALVRDGQWHESTAFDASITLLAAHDIDRRGSYMLYVGTAELLVRLRRIDAGAVRVWMPIALPLQPGDRFVLRDTGRDATIGGGVVLDVAPVLKVSRARPSISRDRVVAERGWVEPGQLARLMGQAQQEAPTVGRWVVDPGVLEATKVELQTAVDAAGPGGLDVSTLSERERAVLATMGVEVREGRVSEADELPADAAALLDELAAGGCSPPTVTPGPALKALQRRGLVVEASGVWFSAGAMEEAIAAVEALLDGSPEGITVGQVRDALGSSRKHVVPLLTYLDANGITRRRGDLRVKGRASRD